MSARVLFRCFVLIVSTVVLCTCASQSVAPGTAASRAARGSGGGPCRDGNGSADRQAPIVCVDDLGATLSVSPDPIVLHDKLRNSAAPVTLQWFTRSGRGNLQVEVQEGCLTEIKCEGQGHCTAQARDIDTETKCKYDVWTGTHPRLDPDIVITPCC